MKLCLRHSMAVHLSSCLQRVSGLVLFTAILSSGVCRGLVVTSTGPSLVRRAEGQSVTLGCSYTWGPSDSGELDVEWSLVSLDPTQKDQMLVSFSSGRKYIHALGKGLDFAVPDPSAGDASLSIAMLSPDHSATYRCKVKKSPGLDTHKVSLVVLAMPSVPKCWLEGTEMVGDAVSLHCKSYKGSIPLKYTWIRERGGPLPPILSQDGVTGEMAIRNHSVGFVGIYLCKVTNAVGTQQCRINLSAIKPPNRAGVIVGTLVGSFLLLLILLLFAWLLFYKLSTRHHNEKEFSNEIREDAPAPVSRPVSRGTSRSSRQHPGVSYSEVSMPEPDLMGKGPPPTNSSVYTPVHYDAKYGYAV